MKKALVAGALTVLAFPASALAGTTPTDEKNAAKECKAERAASQEAFDAKYRNFGHCVSQRARDEAAERRKAKSTAKKQCKAELEELGREAFREKYGTNRNKRNAMGKCQSKKAKKVKAKADRKDRQEIAETENRAQQCRAEREQLGEQAFAEKYGTNRNKRNAFGKCVSAKGGSTTT